MTETRPWPLPASINIAWILNTLFVLVSTFLAGASYATTRTMHKLLPAIQQHQAENVKNMAAVTSLQSSIDAARAMQRENEQRQQIIQRTCLQVLGGHQ